MYKTVMVDGNEMGLSANAATPFRYKQVFKSDLFSVFGNEKRAEEEGVEVVTKLAYIMHNQADGADMNKLNEADFITWLEGFSAMAFVNASEEIINAYMDSTVGTATPKEEE